MKTNNMSVASILALAGLAAALTTNAVRADDCKPSVQASAALTRVPGKSEDALVAQACKRAVSKWSIAAKSRYGGMYAAWSRSKDRSKNIRHEGRQLICIIRAKPCAPTVQAPPR